MEVDVKGPSSKGLIKVRSVSVYFLKRNGIWKWEFYGFRDEAKRWHRSALAVHERRERVHGRCTDAFIGGFGLKFC